MTMSDKKANDSRRKLLKSLAAGSGAVVAGKSLPESWSRPVIDSVILPAHASTTDDTGSGGTDTTDSSGTDNTTTTTTTAEPCNIAGEYCWVLGKFTTTFTVGSNGSINILRKNKNGPTTWEGSGTASDAEMGGTFNIDLYESGSNRPTSRNFQGDVVCNSTSITGIYNDENDNNTNYTARQDDCLTDG